MIHVRVFQRTGRKYFEAYWEDPVTGLKKVKSTKATLRRDAERFAARLESKLNSGQAAESVRMTWADFRVRFEREFLPLVAHKTRLKYRSAFNALEQFIAPKYVAAVNESVIGQFAARLREKQRTELTVKGHLSCLRACLNWGRDMQIVNRVPTFKMPKRASVSGGRAITTEEFDRMLDVVPKALTIKLRAENVLEPDEATVESWRHLLWGLWYSGLRLDEAMVLHWSDDRRMAVDFTGRHPMFRIHPEAEKGNQERLLPMAPEFSEFLLNQECREGHVFRPVPLKNGNIDRLRTDWVSKVLSRIGKKAGVKVRERANGRVKFASAHDLRRAFGFRWAMRVLPPVLMELMRHESISTTLTFYAGRNADVAARQMWDAYRAQSAGGSDTRGNTTVPPDSGQFTSHPNDP